MRFVRSFVSFLALAYCAIPACAQVDRSTLNGTVFDPSGAVVAGAHVEAVSTGAGKQREVLSNDVGIYLIPKLPSGQYVITFSHDGFQTLKFEKVDLEVGKTVTLDARFQLATTSAQVEVLSATPLLERNSAEIAGTVGSAQIQNLPTNGRNWAALLILAPLAIDDGGGDERSIRFAGRARDDNNYKIDGVDATGIQEQAQKSSTRLQISADAIEEYRVSSALYTAEYGAGAGGQVDLVSKSGSNEFHGSAFEFLRNSEFDSRSFLDLDLDPAAPAKTGVPPFRMNQFGGTFGGPIVKDRTFFFLSYEGIRQFRGQTLHAFVPNLALRQQILQTSPQMKPILDAYPIGQLAVDSQTDEYTHQGQISSHEDSGLFRLDHRFSDNTFFYARLVIDDAFAQAPNGNLRDTQQVINRPQNYVLSLQHILSPTIFNEAKFGVNRSPFHNPQASVLNYSVSSNNFETLNNDSADIEIGTSWSYIDNLTINRGRHTFKMGIEVRRIWLNQGQTNDTSVSFTDNNSLIHDQLDSFTVRTGWYSRGLRHTFILPYFQDEWKVRPDLTLNLGLRWEYYAPITEVNDHVTLFDLYGCHGICPPGAPLEYPNYTNFDPRVGIAYAPTAKTVVRTGWGIYHGAAQNDDRNSALESSNTRISLTSADVPNLSFPIEPFLGQAIAGGQTPRALNRHHKDLYAMEYGLSVQQNLPANFLLDAGYFGSSGRRLFARSFVNVIDPVTGQRPLPGFSAVDIKNDDGVSSFNSLHLSASRRLKNGFLWEAKYLWSHSINDGSIGGGEANAPENVACRSCDRGPSAFDVRQNLVVNSVYELPFGPGKPYWSQGLGSRIFGGWQLSGIGVWHTGHPLTVTINPDSSLIPDGNGGSDQRPDVVPGVSVVPAHQNANNWINAAAFTSPPTDSNGKLLRFGNAGRGLVRSPTTWQVDVAITKEFKLTERVNLEFIAQAFNLFNRNQLADPNFALNYNPPDSTSAVGYLTPTSSFGQITSLVNQNSNSDKFAADNTGSGLPRELQFALRLRF
jgi:hypothetical protein